MIDPGFEHALKQFGILGFVQADLDGYMKAGTRFPLIVPEEITESDGFPPVLPKKIIHDKKFPGAAGFVEANCSISRSTRA